MTCCREDTPRIEGTVRVDAGGGEDTMKIKCLPVSVMP